MLVLASASPRRRDLLAQAGFQFTVLTSPVDETPKPGEPAAELAQRLAREKAEAVARLQQTAPDAVILGADTVVVCGNEILGKPQDAADAQRMLRLLSGQTHAVITGVCVVASEERKTAAETTRVTVSALSEADITAYIASGEPFGKAGAYAIQGLAAQWIPRVEGCYFNVVGLPLARAAGMLREAGVLPKLNAPQLG
jgi:septum formation protein